MWGPQTSSCCDGFRRAPITRFLLSSWWVSLIEVAVHCGLLRGSRFQGHDATSPFTTAHIQHTNESEKQVTCFLTLHTGAIWTLSKSCFVSHQTRTGKQRRFFFFLKLLISSYPFTDKFLHKLHLSFPSWPATWCTIASSLAFSSVFLQKITKFPNILCWGGVVVWAGSSAWFLSGGGRLCGGILVVWLWCTLKESICLSVSAVLTVAGSTPRVLSSPPDSKLLTHPRCHDSLTHPKKNRTHANKHTQLSTAYLAPSSALDKHDVRNTALF